ncbi:MAG: DUF1573 domain-containing protein [Bacteroidia bacterium]|nr:DUF1573 domain-containing protein [Bacteroidia bacterium]
MKKFSILALAVLLFVGFQSCQKDGGNTGDNGNSGEVTDASGNNVAEVTKVPPPTQETNVSTLPPTSIAFPDMKHDFGKITEGEVVAHTFSFKNTGDNPLKIENVKPSCGCTTPDWTREEVAPGGEGFIKVEFDSKGKSGQQTKTVTVTSNTPERNTVLTFSGEVVKPAQ